MILLRLKPKRLSRSARKQNGVAAVELAFVLPILLVVLFGIIDFGLYFYNDLQLTHVARDAARYLSVGNEAGAEDTVDNAVLISTTVESSSLEPGSHDEDATVTLTATFHAITPLPGFTGIGSDMPINATAIMRRE